MNEDNPFKNIPDPMKGHGRYILNDRGEPVEEPDLFKWAGWVEKAHRTREKFIANETFDLNGVKVRVSTIFLMLDHSWMRSGNGEYTGPVLWETMIFGGALDQEQNRCSGGREQAEAMHQDMVERVKAVEALKE